VIQIENCNICWRKIQQKLEAYKISVKENRTILLARSMFRDFSIFCNIWMLSNKFLLKGLVRGMLRLPNIAKQYLEHVG